MNPSIQRPTQPAMSQKPAQPRSITRGLLKILARILTLLVILVLSLPVAILPIGSAVPGPLTIGLALAIVVLIVLLIRAHWTPRAVGFTLLGMLAILLVATLASQAYAATPA